MGTSTISMVIFNRYVSDYQRVDEHGLYYHAFQWSIHCGFDHRSDAKTEGSVGQKSAEQMEQMEQLGLARDG